MTNWVIQTFYDNYIGRFILIILLFIALGVLVQRAQDQFGLRSSPSELAQPAEK